ncbi:uncharacterized protein LOC101901401 [Musca domestica]|uniref:Uncharacterized protein LOC101901401 n=1 Tax=Musca domestica TaxID=7370 RepID=A0A1I8NAZ4_MUSDO|nr:uncharacterized protein LOC101901401 [Musca domestica]
MDLRRIIFLFITCILSCCNSQTYSQGYRYPVQRRAGYSYTPTSYNRGAVSVSNNRNAYSSAAKPYYRQSSSGYRYPDGQNSNVAVKGYSSTAKDTRYPGTYSTAYSSRGTTSSSTPVRWYASSEDYKRNNYITSPSTISQASNNEDNKEASQDTKDYLTNSYNENNSKLSGDKSRYQSSQIDKTDTENSKFAGADNQEQEDESSPRTALQIKRRKLLRRRLAAAAAARNRCLAYGRDAAANKNITPPPREQGRFLFDVNVYKVYPQAPVGAPLGCGGGFGGGGFGGGLFGDDLGGYGGGLGGGLGAGAGLADPLLDPLYPPPLNQFLGLFAPGILNNALAVTARPLADPLPPPTNSAQDQDLQNDPDVDPDYQRPVPLPVRRPRPNRVYYDSAGATPLTPAQLVGGVATTVNGIIQQLTGNVQPVYQSSYRSSTSNRSNRYG